MGRKGKRARVRVAFWASLALHKSLRRKGQMSAKMQKTACILALDTPHSGARPQSMLMKHGRKETPEAQPEK